MSETTEAKKWKLEGESVEKIKSALGICKEAEKKIEAIQKEANDESEKIAENAHKHLWGIVHQECGLPLENDLELTFDDDFIDDGVILVKEVESKNKKVPEEIQKILGAIEQATGIKPEPINGDEL